MFSWKIETWRNILASLCSFILVVLFSWDINRTELYHLYPNVVFKPSSDLSAFFNYFNWQIIVQILCPFSKSRSNFFYLFLPPFSAHFFRICVSIILFDLLQHILLFHMFFSSMRSFLNNSTLAVRIWTYCSGRYLTSQLKPPGAVR